MGGHRTLPRARPATEFLVEELAGEVLVYDLTAHRAHCLTPAVARVWRLCDGRTSVVAAEQALADGADSLADVLAQLEKADLVRASRPTINRSRRALVHKGAMAAGLVLASPIIFSIVAPSVAEATSTCGTKGNDCCANQTCDGVPMSKACVGTNPGTCQ